MSSFAMSHTTALDAANYLLVLAHRDGISIDPLKLQKLLYYCQCWSLRDGQRLFDEVVEAWKHGPVVRIVWKAYSGSSNILRPDAPFYELSPDRMDMIHGVWESLKHLPSTTLSDKTHEPGSAWSIARGELPQTAESDRPLDLADMASDAEKMRRSIETQLDDAWGDLSEFQR